MKHELAILELTVGAVTRGTMRDVNTHKAVVQATHDDSGAQLAYWTLLNEAPRVGAVLEVTVTELSP